MFEFGDKVREVVTGFEGIVIGKSQWMTGCTTVGVQRADKDGKPETEWFDESRLELLLKGSVLMVDGRAVRGRFDVAGEGVPPPVTVKGGPQPTPRRQVAGE